MIHLMLHNLRLEPVQNPDMLLHLHVGPLQADAPIAFYLPDPFQGQAAFLCFVFFKYPDNLRIQQDKPEDFVIATGVQHSVREFTDLAFKHAGIELKFEGEGINEKGIVVNGPENLIGKTVVAVSEDFYRPTDVVNLWGDPTKAKAKLKWNPNKTSFEELVKLMVESDMAKVASEDAAMKVRTNLAEYLEKGIVK